MLKSRLPQIVIELDVIVNDRVEHGAETVRDRAKERVPVATGLLQDRIHVVPGRLEATVEGGDTEAWYGHLVEHGTSRVPPHPFLVPALEESRDGVVKDVRDGLRALG